AAAGPALLLGRLFFLLLLDGLHLARRAGRRVLDRPELAVAEVHPLHLGPVERTGAPPAEHRQLVPRLVDRAVAVEALGDGQRRALGLIGGDQPRRRPRAEAGVARVVARREELEDAETVLAVGDVGEGAGVGHADLDVPGVVELAVGGEGLV